MIKEITKELADEIIETRELRGLFWFEDKGAYIGIDNLDGEANVEEFGSYEECAEWLMGGCNE